MRGHTAPMMETIPVSPELLSCIGTGSIPKDAWPADPVAFRFTFGHGQNAATVEFVANPRRPALEAAVGDEVQIILLASRDVCERIIEDDIDLPDGAVHFLPTELRSIAIALRDSRVPSAAQLPYRTAKSIELLCDVLGLIRERRLVPAASSELSERDSQRLLEARRIIDESWSEKLTLESISRACGLNRNKLTSGFRKMYDCTVTDAITAQRLRAARHMLLSTELPVSSIGYKCGYLNNASFARAFSRHFGVAPTMFRAMEGAMA